MSFNCATRSIYRRYSAAFSALVIGVVFAASVDAKQIDNPPELTSKITYQFVIQPVNEVLDIACIVWSTGWKECQFLRKEMYFICRMVDGEEKCFKRASPSN